MPPCRDKWIFGNPVFASVCHDVKTDSAALDWVAQLANDAGRPFALFGWVAYRVAVIDEYAFFE